MVVLWTLGMVLVVMFVGWLSFDLWAAFSERRQLAAAADQAAQAGATALDVDAFRAGGVQQLDPALAETRAEESLGGQDVDGLTGYEIDATTAQVVVVLRGEVDLGLLRIFDVDGPPLQVEVTAIGVPQGEP
jgi:Flp pilus assembly protein TadG